jgi:hypothetical protein
MTAALSNLNKASRSRVRIVSAPETRGSLGIMRLEYRYQRTAGTFGWEFFHVQFGCLFKIGDCFFDTLSLTDGAYLGALRHIKVAFFV